LRVIARDRAERNAAECGFGHVRWPGGRVVANEWGEYGMIMSRRDVWGLAMRHAVIPLQRAPFTFPPAPPCTVPFYPARSLSLRSLHLRGSSISRWCAALSSVIDHPPCARVGVVGAIDQSASRSRGKSGEAKRSADRRAVFAEKI